MSRHITNLPAGGYVPRVVDSSMERMLRASGAVHVTGPKWCGKTKTAEHFAASCVYMQDPDRKGSLLALAEMRPSAILEGAEPRLIDEWQEAPQLWDAVRFEVDRGAGKGRFILTGSSTPKKKPAHSGVGRIAPLRMRTMSLFESGDSSAAVSLKGLFDGEDDVAALADFTVEEYAFAICRGGWPEAVLEPDGEIALMQAGLYVDELINANIEEMDGVRRNVTWMRSIMRSYARNVASQAALSTIAADMQGEPPSDATVADYVDALSRAHVTEDLAAWKPRLRSKTAVRTSPTRHFTDPAIAAALLHVTPTSLLEDFETFGLLFESLCVHDLRVYAEALGGTVYHYRDKTGLEADAVIVLPDGRWAPVEVKMGYSKIDEGAAHLIKLAARVDTQHEGTPSFLMVLTATEAAYRRPDGVIVAPLACLAP
ncbi:MAG TPA: ATP-binding protein [Candidatus Aphodovivens excrementavium]|nr:ATP-binding protein [Candidatus Aphodovivens excrementavium]